MKGNAMDRLRQLRPNLFLILSGALLFVGGMSAFTFVQAEGLSYFSNEPSACMNCHVMQDQFDAWEHSSHARVATCNDCHASHDNLVNKYFSKGVNGFNHSAAFTLGTYGNVITIKDYNRAIVNDSCVYCHTNLVSEIEAVHTSQTNCTHCHAGVGHPLRD